MALRKITEARIVCANSIHEFNTLDGFLDDWNATDEPAESTALDIHLHCESGAKEAHTILDILTGFLTSGTAPGWLWMEAEIRQEYAVGAADHITQMLSQLESSNPELGLKEMGRRAGMIKTKLEGLKSIMSELQTEMQRQALEQTQASTQSEES